MPHFVMHMGAEYDWHLVVLAVVLCFLASAVAVNLFHRALRIAHAWSGSASPHWLMAFLALASVSSWQRARRWTDADEADAQPARPVSAKMMAQNRSVHHREASGSPLATS
jgi:hypothetical protein